MKICIIYNTAPRYRESIFRLLDTNYDCDWFFGITKTDIKEMDTSLLKNVSYYKTYGNCSKICWKTGNIKLLFKSEYKKYLILAESHAVSDYIFLLFKYIFFPSKKVYIWTHGMYGKESFFEKKMKLIQFHCADGIFVYNDYSRNLMIDAGIKGEKIYVIHNSLHYEQQKMLRERIVPSNVYKVHFRNDSPTIIFIGRLTKVKQLDMLLNAVNVLKLSGVFYNVVFIGDGEARCELELLVSRLGLSDCVWFYGACYDEKENSELVYNADLCVAPGNVGLTAMHAMVFGTPVISHNDFSHQMPEFEAIEKGKTGTFFERGDYISLANAIKSWFAENEEKRGLVRKKCYEKIDNEWNPNFQLNVLKNIFR